ncbi:apolipoprotein A-IV-like [Dendropsophus ebraccatus]|uniref:apolipoprotein A-IV-like n=1 Tax=Dendropsophus ebraccatus TaxID=150705 RepID=UPI003831475D
MLVEVVTITIMCSIAGAIGNVDNKMLADAFLYYLDEPCSRSTKDSSIPQLPVSDFSNLLNSALTLDEKNINAELLNKVSFFAKAIYEQATKDSEKLQLEFEQLKLKLSPYSEEVTRLFSKTTSDLQITLNPYVTELQNQLETITLDFVKKLKSINLDLYSSSASMTVALVAFSQKLEAKMDECLNALRNVIATCTGKVKEKIELQVAALYQSLTPLVEDLQDPLRKHMENLSFLMKKSVMLIESKILENTAMLEKQITVCTSLLKEKSSLILGNVRKTLTLCLFDISQKITVFKDLVTPYRETLIKSVVLRLENIQDQLGGAASVSLQDKKNYLEKNLFDKISDLLNSTILTTVSKTFTE